MKTIFKEDTCPSCGYTRAVRIEYVDDVVRFKSGKRKGEIKEVRQKDVELSVGHSDFGSIKLVSGINSTFGGGLDVKYCNAKVCPECKTILLDEAYSLD
jgi:hypothetical protein